MKNFILGTIFGFIIGGVTIAYADIGILWNSSQQPIGITSNPLYVQGV